MSGQLSLTEKLLVGTLLVSTTIGWFAFVSGIDIRAFRVPADSMAPTIAAGEHVLTTRAGIVERGDVIVFRHPAKPGATFVKRVVALGGDRIEIRDKMLFVNGARISEPFVVHHDPRVYPPELFLPLPYRMRDQFEPLRIPLQEYFVLGDNRDSSWDSRYFGGVPRSHVIGEVHMVASWSRGFQRVRH